MEWRTVQRNNFTQFKTLFEFLQLTEKHLPHLLQNSPFPLNLPYRLAAKIAKGTLEDPILLQFLPQIKETVNTPGFLADPVGDEPSRTSSKLLHKYHGRALIVCTSACAMNCRYCFRKNFSYETNKSFDAEIEAISEDPTITEVLLSGGDPLSLSNATLKDLIERLSAIPHVQRLRFHTRFPIGIPERIDAPFLHILETSRLQTYFVIHCNHANELDDDIFAALKKIQCLGIPVLNQSVLLKDVNDDVDTLKTLCKTLSDHGVIPYYIHQLDRVQGSAHYEVPEERGRQIVQQLQTLLPGYAVPKYVREIAGEPGKTPLID